MRMSGITEVWAPYYNGAFVCLQTLSFNCGPNLPFVLSLAIVHLWVGEEEQPLTHDPALTHDPNLLSSDLNHPSNHNLGTPEGLDAHAVSKD